MGLVGSLRAALAIPAPPPMHPAGSAYVDEYGPVSPWEDPTILTRLTIDNLWPGLDPEQWPVTRGQALTVPAVTACYLRIVGTLSRLPLVATYDATGQAWTAEDGLLDQPDPAVPHSTTMRDTLSDILFHGLAWWAVVNTYADGRPMDAVAVPVDQVRSDDDGHPAVSEQWAEALRKQRGLAVCKLTGGAHYLMRFDGPHPGLCNIGQTTVRSAMRLEQSVLTAAANPVPSLELHQTTDAPIDDSVILDMIRQWEGARKRSGVGFTNSAVEVRTHGVQPEQLLIQARNQQAVDVARLSGIPAASIDAAIPGASLTYANLVDRLRDLINLGLQPYAQAVTGRLSMADVVPRGVRVNFDYTELYPDVPAASAKAPPAADSPTLLPVRNPA